MIWTWKLYKSCEYSNKALRSVDFEEFLDQLHD